MFQRLIFPKDLSEYEARHIVEPALLSILVLCAIIFFYGILFLTDLYGKSTTLILSGAGCVFAAVLYAWLIYAPQKYRECRWPLILVITAAAVVGILLLPQLSIISYIIITLAAIILALLWGRLSAYILIGAVSLAQIWLLISLDSINAIAEKAAGLIAFLQAVIVIELIQRLAETNLNRITRLQTINEFARQISSSIEAEKVLAVVGEALQKAIRADTYFLGVLKNPETVMFHLMYDDGQDFPPGEFPLAGTLSGWVIRNQRSLFIPDLRHDVNLEGVRVILTGNNRNNASWMGVPMRAGSINGLIVVASYTPYAFDRTALELLENLAQHVALALDNAQHHKEVETQSQLDSLTQVYKHGHIIKILQQEAEKALNNNAPLSLIMLDIDAFKQYNDNYGHQTGDDVLVQLTRAIQQHIKTTDSLGRWGGEEFAVILPGAGSKQAHQVAIRIRETIKGLSLKPIGGQTLPFPTLSQGIAVFPSEVTDIEQFIHLADKRLYIAKDRGRDQIEPGPELWEKILC